MDLKGIVRYILEGTHTHTERKHSDDVSIEPASWSKHYNLNSSDNHLGKPSQSSRGNLGWS